MDTLGIEPRASRMLSGVIPLHHVPYDWFRKNVASHGIAIVVHAHIKLSVSP